MWRFLKFASLAALLAATPAYAADVNSTVPGSRAHDPNMWLNRLTIGVGTTTLLSGNSITSNCALYNASGYVGCNGQFLISPTGVTFGSTVGIQFPDVATTTATWTSTGLTGSTASNSQATLMVYNSGNTNYEQIAQFWAPSLGSTNEACVAIGVAFTAEGEMCWRNGTGFILQGAASTANYAFNLTSTLIKAGFPIESTGTVPTGTTGTCSTGTITGGAVSGSFTAPTCATGGTFILSGMATMAHGYVCSIKDLTGSFGVPQTGYGTTSATFTTGATSGTTSGDSMVYNCDFGF